MGGNIGGNMSCEDVRYIKRTHHTRRVVVPNAPHITHARSARIHGRTTHHTYTVHTHAAHAYMGGLTPHIHGELTLGTEMQRGRTSLLE